MRCIATRSSVGSTRLQPKVTTTSSVIHAGNEHADARATEPRRAMRAPTTKCAHR